MRILKTIIAIIVVTLSSYSLITGEYGTMPYILLLLGGMFLVWGVNEFKENRKTTAIFLLLTAGFALFVGIYTLFF